MTFLAVCRDFGVTYVVYILISITRCGGKWIDRMNKTYKSWMLHVHHKEKHTTDKRYFLAAPHLTSWMTVWHGLYVSGLKQVTRLDHYGKFIIQNWQKIEHNHLHSIQNYHLLSKVQTINKSWVTSVHYCQLTLWAQIIDDMKISWNFWSFLLVGPDNSNN